jgi:excisionase family DNA binding protein
MAKKYLTIEEAAELLGVEPSDLSRLREKGEIRAFADRGNWKFRQDDVDELARKRQTDSDPDVPIFRSPPSSKPTKKDEFSDSFSLDIPGSGKDDSSINLGNEPDEVIGNQPTIVRKGGLDDLMGSDSDVRLVFDDSLMPDNSEDVLSDSEHSDSDVRLINFGDSSDEGSDSDVKLVPDKASVKTPHNQGQGSDSDVTLIGSKDDSFTLDLDQSDGSFVFGGESSGIALGGFSDDEEEEGDSGITLELAGDSGIALDIGDSGISLDPGGSGISLESDDSSLLLAGDSGISLGGPSDSGIALEGLAGDSGVKNKDKGKSKNKRQANNDLGGTLPEIPLMSLPEDDLQSTQMEVPLLGGQDSEFEFTASPLDDDSNANVPMLRDSGDSSAKKGGAKNANKKKGKTTIYLTRQPPLSSMRPTTISTATRMSSPTIPMTWKSPTMSLARTMKSPKTSSVRPMKTSTKSCNQARVLQILLCPAWEVLVPRQCRSKPNGVGRPSACCWSRPRSCC